MGKASGTHFKDTTLEFLIETRSKKGNPLNDLIEESTGRMIKNNEPQIEKRIQTEFFYLLNKGYSHDLAAYVCKQADDHYCRVTTTVLGIIQKIGGDDDHDLD